MPERFGSYTVYEEVGIGGMASVHIAKTSDGRTVALKRLLPHVAGDAETLRKFEDEGKLVRQLKHPNIATTYECGEVKGTLYIAMEYVPGHTLTQLIKQCGTTIGVIPFPISVNILIQLCSALDYAHNLCDSSGKSLKIIHRDISPQNVILSSTGVVKLIDFGIAKATSSTVHSHVGVVKGKFGYMAPEYLSGKLDLRADLWALGTVAHELLTNRRLFKGDDDFKTMYAVKYADIEPPSSTNPDVPPDFDVIVMTALQRDPDRRWQSAAAMRSALANAATELQTTVSNRQLIEWVDWTFTPAPPREGSELSQLIALLEQPLSKSTSIQVHWDDDAAKAKSKSKSKSKSKAEAKADDEAKVTAKANVTEKSDSSAKPDAGDKPDASDKPDDHANDFAAQRDPARTASEPTPSRAASRPMQPPKRHPVRVALLLLALIAAGAYAAYYYDYLPAEVTDLLPTVD